MTAETDALTEVVRPLAQSRGLDLEDVTITPAGRRRRVALLVDRDGGVTLDECADLSQALSASLDHSDVLGDLPYVLEVGSPGLDRPLTAPRHWRRNVGRLVRVVGTDDRVAVGRVISADDDGADLDVDGVVRRIPYADVRSARAQVEFSRPGPDGAGPDGAGADGT